MGCKMGKPGINGKCSFGGGCSILACLICEDQGSCERVDEGTVLSLRCVKLLRAGAPGLKLSPTNQYLLDVQSCGPSAK